MKQKNSDTEHLSDESLASFIDRTLGIAERKNAEEHLLECRECRAVIMESLKAKQEKLHSRRKIRVLQVIVPLAMAASIAWMMVMPLTEQTVVSSSVKEIVQDEGWLERIKVWLEKQIDYILKKD